MRFAPVLIAIIALAWSAIPAAANDAAPGTPRLTIVIGSSVSDRDVQLAVGDIVRFVNRDGERHRIRSRSGSDGFDTGNLEPGEAIQIRFATAGTFTYVDERDRDDAAYHGRIVVGGAGAGVGVPTPGDPGVPVAPGTGGAAPSTASVTIGDRVFQPSATTVAVGGSVTFENADGDEHTATSTGGGGIDSGTLAPGGSYRATFPSAGTFDFLCAFHPDMRGSIRVVVAADAPASAPAAVPRATPSPTPAVDPEGTRVRVDIADLVFKPTTIQVAAGTTVDWTNRGAAPHTVSAADGSFDSGVLDAGGSYSRTFETTGSYGYLCQVHPTMTAVVEVVAPAAVRPAPSAAAAAGSVGGPSAGQDAPASSGNDLGSLIGIVLAVTLVSIATGLFARVIGRTVQGA
jgi:plastocyanin